jgi:hypothetical protein
MKDESDATRDQKDAELEEELEKWPDVAEPMGGYAGLLIRVTGRIGGIGETSEDGLDLTTPPDLPSEEGEQEEGPRRERDSQAYIAARAALATDAHKEEKAPGGMDAEGAGSGKIDLKTLLAQGLDLRGGAEEPAAKPELAAAPAIESQRIAAVQAEPERKSRAGLVVVIALLVGVGGFLLWRTMGGEPDAERTLATSPGEQGDERAPAVDRAPESEEARRGEAPAEEASAAAEEAGEADEAVEAEDGDEGSSGRRSSRRRAARGRGRAEAAPAERAAPAPATARAKKAAAPAKGRGASDLDALLSGAASSGQGKAPGAPEKAAGGGAAPPPAGALPQPNRAQIQTAMNRVSGTVRNCTQGTPGTAMVRITFASGGNVTAARVLSGYTGAIAACIGRAVRGARVPAFTRPTVTVTFPFVIRPPE